MIKTIQVEIRTSEFYDLYFIDKRWNDKWSSLCHDKQKNIKHVYRKGKSHSIISRLILESRLIHGEIIDPFILISKLLPRWHTLSIKLNYVVAHNVIQKRRSISSIKRHALARFIPLRYLASERLNREFYHGHAYMLFDSSRVSNILLREQLDRRRAVTIVKDAFSSSRIQISENPCFWTKQFRATEDNCAER